MRTSNMQARDLIALRQRKSKLLGVVIDILDTIELERQETLVAPSKCLLLAPWDLALELLRHWDGWRLALYVGKVVVAACAYECGDGGVAENADTRWLG